MCKLPLPQWKQANYPVIHIYATHAVGKMQRDRAGQSRVEEYAGRSEEEEEEYYEATKEGLALKTGRTEEEVL